MPPELLAKVTFIARSLLSTGVRLSVRLSVTFVCRIQTAKDIIKLLSGPGSPNILIFNSMYRYPISRGTLSARALYTLTVVKICDFRLKSLCISETIRYKPITAMER